MNQAALWDLPLRGRACALAGEGVAFDYARALLEELGATTESRAGPVALSPALSWAASGAMALTGSAGAAPRLCPFPLASCADGVIAALNALAPSPLVLNGAALLGERAACAGHRRNGAIAPGGSCRLLRARDGWIALNLARADDWSLLPAWLEMPVSATWEDIGNALPGLDVESCVRRGRLLGLAIAPMAALPAAPAPWFVQTHRISNEPAKARAGAPLVVDLSALWAGPLCGQLLHRLGARVIKVESTRRPDGARQGPQDFYDLLNAGKASAALDFGSAQGRLQLRELLRRADIVIEASRPRALRQLGLHAHELLAENPGLTWISITGYGRDEPQCDWIGFGDDAGVAAGLSEALFELTGEPMFCADAIADPLTGLHAALLAWSSFLGGGGRQLALTLRDVAAFCARFEHPGSADGLRARYRDWCDALSGAGITASAPRARRVTQRARPCGADTQAILTELGIPC